MNARITMQPDVCHGKPCIGGLRYPVALDFAACLSHINRIEPVGQMAA